MILFNLKFIHTAAPPSGCNIPNYSNFMKGRKKHWIPLDTKSYSTSSSSLLSSLHIHHTYTTCKSPQSKEHLTKEFCDSQIGSRTVIQVWSRVSWSQGGRSIDHVTGVLDKTVQAPRWWIEGGCVREVAMYSASWACESGGDFRVERRDYSSLWLDSPDSRAVEVQDEEMFNRRNRGRRHRHTGG